MIEPRPFTMHSLKKNFSSVHGKQAYLSCAKAKTRPLYFSDINKKGTPRLSMVFQ